MNAKYIVEKLNLKVKHALYRNNGYWYHHLRRFPGILIDAGGYVVFETQESYWENQHLQHAQTLHVKNSISSIPGYIVFSDEQKFKLVDLFVADKKDIEVAMRRRQMIDIILRNKKYVKKIKKLYNYRCQLCELQLVIGADQFYSEVHHIVPLGNPHNGKDILENMICVCPNCHVQLDLGAISLEKASFKLTLHPIDDKFAEYYNTTIFQSNNHNVL